MLPSKAKRPSYRFGWIAARYSATITPRSAGSDRPVPPHVQEAAQGLLFVESAFSLTTALVAASIKFSSSLMSELPAKGPAQKRAAPVTISDWSPLTGP